MNILITTPFDDTYLEKLHQRATVQYESWADTFKFWRGAELRQRLAEDQVNILVTEVDRVTADVLEGLQDLKMICVCRGTPSNVDIAAATEQGVIVTRTPGRNAVAVAELTIALMINVARHMNAGERAIRENKWDRSLYFTLAGVELTDRTVGIVGLGAVGREVAKRLRCFDMRILACDPYVSQEVAASVNADLVDLDTLMRESDFVSIHLPVTEETRGLVSAEKIALMKPTAYFINTARAATIDEDAILEALKEKRIAGGAFDVFGAEPVPPESPYLELDNVVMTPHIGGATVDAITNHSRMAFQDIVDYMSGKTPTLIVNPEVEP